MSSETKPQCVLMSTEVELYVGSLQTFPIEEIASKKWFSQHEMIEKLNMQAIISASSNETEYVKDALVTLDKVWKIMIIILIWGNETELLNFKDACFDSPINRQWALVRESFCQTVWNRFPSEKFLYHLFNGNLIF